MVTRIRELLEYKNLTPTQFADLVGVGRPVMSHILSERNKPSLEVVQRIISAFPEVALSWLLSGTGEMLAADAMVPSAASVDEVHPPVVIEEPATSSLVRAAAPLVDKVTAAPTAVATPTADLVPGVASNPATPPATPKPTVITASQKAAPQANPGPATTPPIPKPFRTARAMPPKAEPMLPLGGVAAAAMPTPAIPIAVPSTAPATLVAGPASATPSAPEAAMLPFLAEPGKAIRRIVIFYRDGSFTDYQPEQ